MRCAGCGNQTIGSTGYCQTCKSKRFHAHKRIQREGLIVDQAGGSWWVWDRKGEVLVMGKPTRDDAINALALGDEVDDEDFDENPAQPSIFQLAAAGALQDVILLAGGALIVGVAGYLIYQKMMASVPTVRNTLPLLLPTTPGVDPLPPIDMPGGPIPVPFTSQTDLGSGGSTTPLGPSAVG
jgi:hypothetical protein